MPRAPRTANQILSSPDQSGDQGGGITPAFDWLAVRHFLAVAEAESFKGAARDTGRSINTIRAHIEQLEQKLGAPLFRRSYKGVALTAAGREFHARAKSMQPLGEASEYVASAPLPTGELRLAVTEGLGTFWIVPRVSEFRAREPDVRIHLECTMAMADLRARKIDIAVQLERSPDPDLICVRLGTLHLMPFASQDYIRDHGRPTSIAEALKHRFVIQVADQVRSDVLPVFAGAEPPPQLIAMQTNTSSAHYWAVANSVGIGILPTYARAITRRIVPIDMELKLRRDIWLIYHPDIRRSKVHMRAVEWLRRGFDSAQYPWFSDDFVHPDGFEARFDEANIVPLFAGFSDVEAMPPPMHADDADSATDEGQS